MLSSVIRLATVLSCAFVAGARGAVLTANFDGIPTSSVPSGYTESGLRFTSPTPFQVITGSQGALMFGWGGYMYAGNALLVYNQGWVGIDAPGHILDSVTFKYGFDWNGYSIEFGL